VDNSSLLEIAKLLLGEEQSDRTAEGILHRVMDVTGASRGFIVVREGKSFEQRFEVRFEPNSVSGDERRFSSSLVRQSIANGSVLTSDNTLDDPRFVGAESIERAGAHAVLVMPLKHHDEIYGVVYLERLGPKGPFSPESIRFVSDFAEIAALFLKRAAERDALRTRTRSLERDLFAQHDFKGIVTQNPKMLGLLKVVGQVAPSDTTVLLHGETGTGKELIAQALHVNSNRASKPLVVLHCTALPPTVLESELFGHTRGAFTGAERDRPGRIATAHGGTLFLDEIAEIAPEAQSKLLRFLQFGEVQRLGSDKTDKVDVRVIAATHQSLEELVRTGRFRQDLYYRLKVVDLELPPLRERRDDIPILVEAFLDEFKKPGAERARFTQRAMLLLEAHDYPGNIRELRHAVERAMVLGTGSTLDADLLPADIAYPVEPPVSLQAPQSGVPASQSAEPLGELDRIRRVASDGAEREFLAELLKRNSGNISLASRSSGIHRSYLQRLLTKHGLRKT
jgi:Nif-specific regulatory protein/two-component system response regulator HydG